MKMKEEVQAQLRAEFAGLSDDEARARIAHELESGDGIVARKWRKIRQRKQARLTALQGASTAINSDA